MASSTTKLVSRTRLSSLASRFTSASSFTSRSSPLIRPPFPAPQSRFPLSRSPVELSRLGSIRPYSAVSVKQVVRAFKLDSFKEIVTDYVHNEMTRTWVLIGWRLFLIIATKDAFVYLVLN